MPRLRITRIAMPPSDRSVTLCAPADTRPQSRRASGRSACRRTFLDPWRSPRTAGCWSTPRAARTRRRRSPCRRREPQCLQDDAALHVAGGGANGDPDPDLPGALIHRVPDQPVDAERGQQQREHGKPAEQQHDEASWRDRLVDDLLQGSKVVAGEIRRDWRQRRPDRARKLCRRQRGSDHEIRGRLVAALAHRQVQLVAGALLEGEMAHVADDTHHAPFAAPQTSRRIFPTASSPGQIVRAIVSLMMSTGSLDDVSIAEKSRPARTGMPIAPT